MRTLVHLSDLHFGRVDEALLEPLRESLRAIAPDLLVVSGDLTQRARPEQFEAARRFLDSLPGPQLVVPGNHDVPLYNVFRRFVNPLKQYRRHISGELEPFFIDEEIAVAGLNTARSLTIKDGRVNAEQLALLCERFNDLDPHVARIVVTHHPFDLPAPEDNDDLVWRAGKAMRAFAECGADILLSGHMHVSHAGDTSARYALGGYTALTIHAGTATSTRGRGESNSFNAIFIDGNEVRLQTHAWQPEAAVFRVVSQASFLREGRRWREVTAADAVA